MRPVKGLSRAASVWVGEKKTPDDPNKELKDRFDRENAAEQERELIAEHRAKLRAQRTLHRARLAALEQQLQTQLFTIWNDVWMQRKKVFDDAYKAWFKLMFA